MNNRDLINNNENEIIDVENIYNDIKEKILTARSKMLKHIDTTMTEVYWYVGKITYELSENSTKASYGKKIIDVLSVKLTNEFGSGFSPVSIRRMRRFYEFYPIWSTVSTELSWAHFQELIRLGRGFSFVANQQRIKIGSEYYYPDLVFYNRLAKCFVIIDLKIGKLTHQDIGQMQMYINYYKKTQMIDGENEPIGILLCADKDDAVVEMTLGDSVKNVYASKYLTYMPSKEELIKIIRDEKELYELAQENGGDK